VFAIDIENIFFFFTGWICFFTSGTKFCVCQQRCIDQSQSSDDLGAWIRCCASWTVG
jgi:hypothetical protein